MSRFREPAILIDEITTPDFGYYCTLRGKIFGKDIEKLSISLDEALEDELDRIKILAIDISEVPEVFFKPARFFAMCSYFYETVMAAPQGAHFEVWISEQHEKIFEGIQDTVEFDLNVKAASELPSAISGYVKTKAMDSNALLVYGFSLPLMIICCLAMIGSLIYQAGTLLGFAIAFSAGILFFEGTLLLKMFRRKQREAEFLSS